MDVTTPAEEQTTTNTHEQCTGLMHNAIQRLMIGGFRRYAVDTLMSADGLTSVRHHYTGGEWTLTRLRPGVPPKTETWALNKPLPTVETLVAHILGD